MMTMGYNGISSLIVQNRLLSQARSGARARNAAAGAILNNSKNSASSAQKQAETARKSGSRETQIESFKNYTSMKKAAENLKEHTKKLFSTLDREWENLTEEETAKYRKEAEGEITGFVEDYNTLVKMLGKESSSINSIYLGQLQSYMQGSKNILSEMGITRETDGTLSINQETLKSADVSKLREAFGQAGSFAGKVMERAENIIASAETNLSVLNNSLYAGNYSYNRYGNDIYDIFNGGSNYNNKG